MDASGAPVADVRVSALPLSAPIGTGSGNREPSLESRPDIDHHFVRVTNEYGRARFELPLGEDGHFIAGNRYQLKIKAPGYSRQASTTVDLSLAEPVRTQIRLLAHRTIRLGGTVRSERGQPIAGAKVTASGVTRAQTVTGVDGQYELDPIVVGIDGVNVKVSAPDYATASLRVKEGTRSCDLTLQTSHVLTVLARDQHGVPLVAHDVFVDGTNLGKTDAEGRFRIESISAAEHKIVVTIFISEQTLFKSGGEVRVAGDAGQVEVVHERYPGDTSLVLELVDAATNAPIQPDAVYLAPFGGREFAFLQHPVRKVDSGITAEHLREDRWWLGLTTKDGRRGHCEFTTGVGQPEVRLRLELPVQGEVQGHIDITALSPQDVPEEVTVKVSLIPSSGRRGRGRFTCPGRWRLSSGQHRDNQSIMNKTTGVLTMKLTAGSNFVLEAATPTTLRFDATAKGVSGTATVEVAPGGSVQVALELRPRRTKNGKIVR